MKNSPSSVLKQFYRATPGAMKAVAAFRTAKIRASCYYYDFITDRRYLGWKRPGPDYWKLSSELIFFNHKLEKGLCLPRKNLRFFGESAARETFRLLREWHAAGFDRTAPVYLATIEILKAWRRHMDLMPPPEAVRARLLTELDALGVDAQTVDARYATPIPFRKTANGSYDALLDLAQSRRSVRDFDDRPVDFALVEQAVRIAQLSPSACNRQPCKLHFYDEPKTIARLLALQNGNSGFGDTVPLLAIVTAEYGTFFNSSERIEPVLDGGLFLMSFILALQSLGLSSCCLNWCVLPQRDIEGHKTAQIPENEKILTFLAIGRPREDAITPLSSRRPVEDVIRRHGPIHAD